jgi:hypothetical protein
VSRMSTGTSSLAAVRCTTSAPPELPAGLAAHVEDGELTLPSADVTADLALLIGWARANRVDLTGLEVGSPSLEDAYLALTSEKEKELSHG